jgi:hypothetical protein
MLLLAFSFHVCIVSLTENSPPNMARSLLYVHATQVLLRQLLGRSERPTNFFFLFNRFLAVPQSLSTSVSIASSHTCFSHTCFSHTSCRRGPSLAQAALDPCFSHNRWQSAAAPTVNAAQPVDEARLSHKQHFSHTVLRLPRSMRRRYWLEARRTLCLQPRGWCWTTGWSSKRACGLRAHRTAVSCVWNAVYLWCARKGATDACQRCQRMQRIRRMPHVRLATGLGAHLLLAEK